MPRGKAYVYETGTLIPLIVYFPSKWKHLAAMPIPSVNDRLVSFVDFAPSILSLAGVPVPSFMVGKAFVTNTASKKENIRNTILTFTANQGQSYIPFTIYYRWKVSFDVESLKCLSQWHKAGLSIADACTTSLGQSQHGR